MLTPNRQADKLLSMIEQYQPDIVLTLESDQWWQDQLDQALEDKWPNSVKIPLDNLYGMHMYSRLTLSETEVKWLIQDDIPLSIPMSRWKAATESAYMLFTRVRQHPVKARSRSGAMLNYC